MSGTSGDGVDVAVLRIRGRGLSMQAELLATGTSTFDPDLRRAIQQVRSAGGGSFATLCNVGRQLVEHHARATRDACTSAGIAPSALAAVAAHGQTLFHAPPDTIQWFDPSLLAFLLDCVVVSDFRRADLAAGGQGAPLVPYADLILFGGTSHQRVILNLGGIANVTLLPGTASIDQVRAFDTGPGNCVLDHLCRRLDPTGPGYDLGGVLASRGRVIQPLLTACLSADYSRRPPPKSTDGPAMIEVFERAMATSNVRLESDRLPDLLATACEWTARSIALEVNRIALPDAELIVAGGGVNNPSLLQRLGIACGRRPLRCSDEVGVPSHAREAMAFALLGAATLDGEPSNVPAATGASRRVVLGSITPRP